MHDLLSSICRQFKSLYAYNWEIRGNENPAFAGFSGVQSSKSGGEDGIRTHDYPTFRVIVASDTSSKARTLWITRWQDGQTTIKSPRLVREAAKRSDKGSLW